MAADFVALADLLRPAPAAALPPQAPPAERERPDERVALQAARRFGAALADALEAAVPQLLRELAGAVLARELLLAPCDLPELVRRVAVLAPVVRVRVAAVDAHVAIDGLHVVADPALAAGDAIVELEGGEIDARLGVRLAHVLEALG